MEVTPTPPVAQPVTTPTENSTSVTTTSTNNIWTKVIPSTNKIFMVLSVLLVFGLDLMILISSPGLLNFWIEMLVVFGVFIIFFRLENYLFKSKFANTKSALDPWVVLLVIVRNFVIFLNFIPLIQILGEIIGFFLIIPYLIVYSILISRRFKVV